MSIYLDHQAGSWVVQVCRTRPDGTRYRVTRRVRGELRAATVRETTLAKEMDAEIDRLRLQHQEAERRAQAAALLGLDRTPEGTATKESKPLPTLRDYYCSRVVQHIQALYSPAALQKAVAPWSYLIFHLGDLRLDQITTAVIHQYEEKMTAPGAPMCFHPRRDGRQRKPTVDRLSNGSINKHIQHLMASLRLAADEGVLPVVPRARLLPADDTQEVVPPTDQEFLHLLQVCEDFRDVAPFLPEVVLFAAETGMRESEIMNLTWTQVEMTIGGKGAIRIERRTKGRSRAGKPYRPKHGKFRVVPVSTRAREVLQKMSESVPTEPHAKIFPNRGGPPYVRIEYDADVKGTGYFPVAVESAGLKGRVTFHGLRHYFAVRCLARGIPMSVVSDYLGHTSIELTVKLYGRFSDEAREKWKWIELLDEPVDAVARRRMLAVIDGRKPDARPPIDTWLKKTEGGAIPGGQTL